MYWSKYCFSASVALTGRTNLFSGVIRLVLAFCHGLQASLFPFREASVEAEALSTVRGQLFALLLHYRDRKSVV